MPISAPKRSKFSPVFGPCVVKNIFINYHFTNGYEINPQNLKYLEISVCDEL